VAFIGYLMIGDGFELSLAERDALENANPAELEFVFPLVNGEDVLGSVRGSSDRYVIDFGVRSLNEVAGAAPTLLARVRLAVKPVRDRNARTTYRERWWMYAEPRPGLRAALAPLTRCLVRPFVSKHHVFQFVDARVAIAAPMVAVTSERVSTFAVLQSRIHETWVRLLSSSLEDRLRYSASDCFETFPFPQPDPRAVVASLEVAGHALYDARATYMVDTQQGLTKTYNGVKDPVRDDPRVLELRRLHEAMDRAVLAEYGWTDLTVPPYCPKSDADRGALKAFEDEVIDRLYVLNAERAREEARLGVAPKKAARVDGDDANCDDDAPPTKKSCGTKTAKKSMKDQGKLFDA
jgi:hypothetical protein